MKYKKFYLSLFIVLAFTSCKKPQQFPDNPVITFKNIYTSVDANGFDSKITVLLSFTDGDGDVGYKDIGKNGLPYDDPTSQYYNNYVAKLYEFIDSAWVEYQTVLPLGGRLPYMTPEGKNKTLQGDISCDFDVPPNAVQDTFRLDVFIYDRTLNQSNIVSTPEFILKTQ